MRSLDTNVLLRYLAGDDARQSAAAERVIEEALRNEEKLYLTCIVLCELVWVLARLYRQGKPQIIGHLDQILGTAQFSIEHDALVRAAVRSWRSGKGDFSDHLIGLISRNAGCQDTVTFDRALRHTSGFSVIL
ncbi:MAG TPA: type II toxin-antitoxin system VapC family toxin [Candidatus Acidoferrales bacterium]|nr:type II toxin-antitoxin system VapC family toxin [Candidatus Acidoferrales bacterium]